MNINDTLWVTKWSKKRFHQPVTGLYRAVLKRFFSKLESYGSAEEPLSSIWLSSLSEAMGDFFREGMKVLDYGCGAGRYCDFLGDRLKKFIYYGVEKPGSTFQHGEQSIKFAKRFFWLNHHAKFGYIGSPTEAEAISNVDVVVLGSVFTHVDFEELRRILKKLEPVIKRGGIIVFSIFLSDKYNLEGPNAYGFMGCYERAWFTMEQLNGLTRENGWHMEEKEQFLAQGVNLHHIFVLRSQSV